MDPDYGYGVITGGQGIDKRIRCSPFFSQTHLGDLYSCPNFFDRGYILFCASDLIVECTLRCSWFICLVGLFVSFVRKRDFGIPVLDFGMEEEMDVGCIEWRLLIDSFLCKVEFSARNKMESFLDYRFDREFFFKW